MFSKRIAALVCFCSFAIPRPTLCQTGKFIASGKITAQKGCGDGLDQDSYCGVCGRIGGDNGTAFTKHATCATVCAKLPKGMSDKQVDLYVYAADAGRRPPSPLVCGSKNTAGACTIGWARSEKFEYYPDKNNVCAVVKNWSANRDTLFEITAVRK